MINKKIGYCPGCFDLFHIGHLNLLRNSRENCDYLIAGVVTDEVYRKYKRKMPFIPFEERFNIVNSIKYVDETIAIDEQIMDKIKAWNTIHYDFHFSGSDHTEDWNDARNILENEGVRFISFDYTENISSTQIRNVIEQEFLFNYIFNDIKKKRIVIFGAGIRFNDYMSNYGDKYIPEFAVDNNSKLWGRKKSGIEIREPSEILKVPKDELWLIICMDNYSEVEKQIKNMGINDYRIYTVDSKIIVL